MRFALSDCIVDKDGAVAFSIDDGVGWVQIVSSDTLLLTPQESDSSEWITIQAMDRFANSTSVNVFVKLEYPVSAVGAGTKPTYAPPKLYLVKARLQLQFAFNRLKAVWPVSLYSL